jgi:Short C-terminal domain
MTGPAASSAHTATAADYSARRATRKARMADPDTRAESFEKVCPRCGTDPGGAITCPGCGTNLAYTRLLTRTEWETKQTKVEDTSGEISPMIIRGATYLGGHPKLGKQRISRVEIVVDDRGWTGTRSLSVDSSGREVREVQFSLPWDAVTEVEVEVGGQHAMATRLLAAGVVGVLTAKRKVFLILTTAEGDAFFELHSRHPERIRAQLSPWTKAHLTSSVEASHVSRPPSAAPDAASPVGRLKELADLRDRGVIDAEEFELLKADLLSKFK